MIRTLLNIVGSILVVALSAAGADYKFFSPYAFDQKVEVRISGRSRSYYELSGDKRVEVRVKGPVHLRVVSRVALESEQDTVEYRFYARREGAKKHVTFRHRSHELDNASLVSDGEGRVTSVRSRIISVPRGDQTYVFYLPNNSKQTVLLRFARESREFAQGDKIIAMTPVDYTSRVDLVTREEASAYYRVGGNDRVVLRLNGPATLKVLNRIEFDQNMNGRQKWRVQVIEDGQVKATHSLSAKRSQVTTYREQSALIPSHARAIFIEIPAGSHEYEFKLPDNHRTALFRFLMPEKQLERG